MSGQDRRSKPSLVILPGPSVTTGVAVTWVVERAGDRVVVASRWVDRLPALWAALRDEERMARYQGPDAAARRRVERLPPTRRVDVIVTTVEPEPERVVATRTARPSSATKAYFPRLLP